MGSLCCGPYSSGNELLLAAGGSAGVAQVAILVLTALTLLLLIDSGFTRNAGEYVSVVLMAAAGGLIISAAQDLLVIFTGLELLSLGLYILTAFAKQSGKSAEAAMKYYLFGGMSAAFLLFGFSYLYGLTGSTSLHRVVQEAYFVSMTGGTPLLYSCAGHDRRRDSASRSLLCRSICGRRIPTKARPLRPRHSSHRFRRSRASRLLISISTAMLHAFNGAHIARVVAVFDLAGRRQRRSVGAAAPWSTDSDDSLRCLDGLSAIWPRWRNRVSAACWPTLPSRTPATFCLGLRSSRRSNLSAQAILYYIVTYGLTTIGAFGVVGVVERATGSDKLDAFLGLQKRNPLLAAVLLVLFLSLAGIPPLVGFWAKFNLFAAVLGVGAGKVPFALVALAIAFSAVSLYYYLQVLKRAYVMPATDESPIRAHPVTTGRCWWSSPLRFVVLGCFPALLQNWIASFYR